MQIIALFQGKSMSFSKVRRKMRHFNKNPTKFSYLEKIKKYIERNLKTEKITEYSAIKLKKNPE